MDFGVSVVPDNQTVVDVIRKYIAEQTLHQGTEDAFFVMDLGHLVRTAEQWKHLLPEVHPYYAVKTNPDPVLLQVLTRMGFGFDCASKHEIQIVLNLGVSPSKIVYAQTRKQPSHLRYASSIGIELAVFDDPDELYKIKEVAPHMKLLLRLSTKGFVQSSTHKMGDKFGCRKMHTKKLLEYAKKLQLDVIGVSFHVGVEPQTTQGYSRAISEAKLVFLEGRDLGFNMSLLDLGGGFPSESAHEISPLKFVEVAQAMRKTISDEFGNDKTLEIIGEPGSLFAARSSALVVNIIGKRSKELHYVSDDSEVDKQVEYFVNDGIFSSFLKNALLPELQLVPKPVNSKYHGAATEKSLIWGQSCTGLDIAMSTCELPDMSTGDWIWFPDHGAYTSAMVTTFNGFQRRPVYHYISESMHQKLQDAISEAECSPDKSRSANRWKHSKEL